jgi:hypothetical protein
MKICLLLTLLRFSLPLSVDESLEPGNAASTDTASSQQTQVTLYSYVADLVTTSGSVEALRFVVENVQESVGVDQHAAASYQAASALRDKNSATEAMTVLQNAINHNPSVPALYFYLGQTAQYYCSVIPAMISSPDLISSPMDPSPCGSSQFVKKQYEQAWSVYSIHGMGSLDFDLPGMLNDLGLLLQNEMKNNEAERAFRTGKFSYDLHMKFPCLKSFTTDLHM